jgi:hypothetical protein
MENDLRKRVGGLKDEKSKMAYHETSISSAEICSPRPKDGENTILHYLLK